MDLFDSLPTDKRLAILSAAFSCFGDNGYRKTSIADIAKAAGISKASVFQYFGTKKALYLYLYDFAVGEISENMVPGGEDFFDCLKAATEAKIKVMTRFPGMFDFLASTLTETDAEIVGALREEQRHVVLSAQDRYYEHVRWDKLKPGIDRAMLLRMLTWINEGYLRDMPAQQSMEQKIAGISRYVDLVQNAVYKDEYLSK